MTAYHKETDRPVIGFDMGGMYKLVTSLFYHGIYSIIFNSFSQLALQCLEKYSWTSLQRSPWWQKKVAIVERLKQMWMYGLSAKKKAVVERWPSVECRLYPHHTLYDWKLKLCYRVFSLTWPASMQIYCNKRKRLHKKRVQLPGDWFGTPTWQPFHCFGTPIWPPWRHVKTLYTKTLRLCHEDYFAPCCMLPIDSPTVSFPQLVHVKSLKKTVGGSFQFT